MATDVIAALGIDKEDMEGRMIIVTEENGANANFILSCIMAERVNADAAVCLVAFHNTFGHYHNVGTKLGYNLNNLLQSEKLHVIEPYKCIFNNLNQMSNFDTDINFLDENKKNIITALYTNITRKIDALYKTNKTVCLIIDDLSHLLDLKIPIGDIIELKQLLNNLLIGLKHLSIVINIAVTNKSDQIVANIFQHISDMNVKVYGLKTGRSSVVSGIMKISRANETEYKLTQQNEYHFKCLDRQIKLFPPGTVTLNS